MQKKILLLLNMALFGLGFANSQAQDIPFRRYCSTDSMTEVAMRQYPEYARQRKEFTNWVRSLNDQSIAKITATPQHTLPIVVHIIHTYGADNITDAQVHDAVRIINEDYQKLNPDTATIIPVYQPLYANVGFQFRLARKDPNGQCTNGITRTYSTLTNIASDNVKQLVMWDPKKYLNIWVVNSIASGAGGYSYLPCGVPQSIEGIVILNTQFGSIGRSNGGNLSVRSLTHEIGHYMGLPHVWGGSNTPGIASNCSMDDGISDTPNTIGSASVSSCNTNARTCNPASYPFPDNVQNYMDYSSCGHMFTNGQKAVMVGALALSCRNILTTQANLVATGTNDGYTATCGPTADFMASAQRLCVGNSVTFTDFSYNLATGSNATYSWSFPGGTPATSTAQNPTVTYNTPGIYDVVLTTTNSAGSDIETRTSYIIVKPSGAAETAPYAEGFEGGNFPTHASVPAKSWELITPANVGWEATPAAAATGITSLRLRNSGIPKGNVTTTISPAIDLTNIANASLKFKVAYAQRSSTTSDKLAVSISNNCGSTWNTRYTKAGAVLSTTNNVYVPGNFIPTATQWRQETVVIPNNYLVNNMVIKIDGTPGDAGNTVYIDDIEIVGTVLGINDYQAANLAFNIYPNPSNGEATVSFALPNATDFSLEVLTVTGQKVGSALNRKAQNNQQELKLNEITGQQLKAGVYLVKLQANGFTTLKKAIVF